MVDYKCRSCDFLEVDKSGDSTTYLCNKKYLMYGVKKNINSFALDFECRAHHSDNMKRLRSKSSTGFFKDNGKQCMLCGRPVAFGANHDKAQLFEVNINSCNVFVCVYCKEGQYNDS